MSGFADAHAQRIFFSRDAFGFIFEVYDMQTLKCFFKFFQQVPGIILAVVINHDHFMRTGIGLGKCARKVCGQVGGFIPGANNYAYRMLLGFIFRRLPEKSESLEKPEIIKKLDKTDKTKQGEPDLTPGQIRGQFKHSDATVSVGW